MLKEIEKKKLSYNRQNLWNRGENVLEIGEQMSLKSWGLSGIQAFYASTKILQSFTSVTTSESCVNYDC